MASYDTGYEDELFEHPVGPSSHCGICYNVVKNPVMCRHNEHLFCRACITRHLMNSQTCPSCLEPLTVDTLNKPSRTVMNLLSELKIRCQFFNRGCVKFIELGNLNRHVTECGFAPVICSNEGCRLEVNKQDLLHHETAVCELRRVQCHDIRQEMDAVKVNLAAMNLKLNDVDEKLDRNEKKLDRNEKKVDEKLDRNEKKFDRSEKRVETNVKAVKDEVVAKVELVQEQLNKQEESNRQLKADNVEMKKNLEEITKQLERLTQQTSHEVQAEQEQEKKGIAEADGMDREPKVVVAGGWNSQGSLNSVEMFSLSKSTWEPLKPMKAARQAASAVVYNNQVFVSGGYCNGCGIKSMEKLSMNVVEVDQSVENCPDELPGPLYGHCSVVFNGRLIVIGGYDVDKHACSDSITEVSLVPPYASKVLATMPQTRWLHAVVLFGETIVILGGRKDANNSKSLKSVLLYDIAKNECKELVPLPYPASKTAAVKWGDDNVIIMGGADSDDKPLNKVLMYNIKNQKSHMLPDMKYKREGCVAAVVRDTVIVMGGQGEKRNYLKAVEGFRFDHFSWEELAEMPEASCLRTAVVC